MASSPRRLPALVGALALFLVLALMVAETGFWTTMGTGEAEDLDNLVVAIFKDQVMSLQVLGVLLTAALIGALITARPAGAAARPRSTSPSTEQPPVVAPAPPTAGPAAAGAAATLAAAPAAKEEEE